MFNPKYKVTPKLLESIKKISVLINDLNSKSFPKIVLVEMEKKATVISSYSSTSIEGNPLPLTEVKKILKTTPKNLRQTEQEVVNYNLALQKLNSLLNKKRVVFNLSFILNVQKMVMNKLVNKYQLGKLRQEPVFVNDPRAGKAIYWPPDHQDTEQLLNDLIAYMNVSRNKIDSLILAGIFHKHFVIVHPFMDGNGRTARLITKILLANLGLNTFNLFSFENYYNQNVSLYFQKVGIFGNYYDLAEKIDYTDWLEYFTDGIIDELLRVSKELASKLISPQTSLKDYHEKILTHIKKYGFITDRDYSRLVKRAKATRNQDFNKLINLKLIQRFGKGRATYYKLRE